MEIDVGGQEHDQMDSVETVEVVASGDDLPVGGGLLDHQHMVMTNSEGILVSSSEVQIALTPQVLEPENSTFSLSGMGVVTIPVEPPTSPTLLLGSKRCRPDSMATLSSTEELQMTDADMSLNSVNLGMGGELPRKKSRNYLDSHKTIEKKRRDRINQCLESLKLLVPDCRQYGSKKLDKAEILEMCIEYIQKMQNQGGVSGRTSTSGMELNLNQREWANDLTTWVINNKLLYSGTGSLDQFCQALLLHLQSMGSGNALASATSMLLHQANSGSEEDSLLRQQTVNAQAVILQQLHQQLGSLGGTKDVGSEGGASTDGGQLQQAQLSQIQALLLLQQHQQLQQQQQQQQQQQETEAQSAQLQQLQQLQALLLQHLTNEATASSVVGPPTSDAVQLQGVVNGNLGGVGVSTRELSRQNMVDVGQSETSSEHPLNHDQLSVDSIRSNKSISPVNRAARVELAHAAELEAAVSTDETVTVYTSGIPVGALDEENLIQVSQAPSSSNQMWSSAGAGQPSSSLLMLGGGSESEGEGGVKSQLEVSILGSQEEVELLTQQEH